MFSQFDLRERREEEVGSGSRKGNFSNEKGKPSAIVTTQPEMYVVRCVDGAYGRGGSREPKRIE